MHRCRKSMKGHFMRAASQELTLRSALSDPLIRLVMEADGVDPRALEAMLMAIASRISRRPVIERRLQNYVKESAHDSCSKV
jgi:hypothetical protein